MTLPQVVPSVGASIRLARVDWIKVQAGVAMDAATTLSVRANRNVFMGKGCGNLCEGAGKAAEVQGNRRDRGRGKLRGILGG